MSADLPSFGPRPEGAEPPAAPDPIHMRFKVWATSPLNVARTIPTLSETKAPLLSQARVNHAKTSNNKTSPTRTSNAHVTLDQEVNVLHKQNTPTCTPKHSALNRRAKIDPVTAKIIADTIAHEMSTFIAQVRQSFITERHLFQKKEEELLCLLTESNKQLQTLLALVFSKSRLCFTDSGHSGQHPQQ
jgi:hypothetical protein